MKVTMVFDYASKTFLSMRDNTGVIYLEAFRIGCIRVQPGSFGSEKYFTPSIGNAFKWGSWKKALKWGEKNGFVVQIPAVASFQFLGNPVRLQAEFTDLNPEAILDVLGQFDYTPDEGLVEILARNEGPRLYRFTMTK